MLIDADTLAGRAQHPGELVGLGPVTAELALEWAADAAWRRWTRDPVSGYLLDYGTVYNPPPSAARLRDRPRRGQPVPDVEHAGAPQPPRPRHPVQPRRADASANISALAGHPHRAKHEAGWQLQLHHDGVEDWTSPAGKTYRTASANYNWMRPAPTDPPEQPGTDPPPF